MADEVTLAEAPPPAAAPATVGDGPRAEMAGYNALATLVTGPALYGGLGWLLDRWLGITVFTVVGMVGGMALAVYAVMVRYRVR
ncbi:MAG: hypothetical protein U0Q15_17260 [Kineosporiaceae bacterium]